MEVIIVSITYFSSLAFIYRSLPAIILIVILLIQPLSRLNQTKFLLYLVLLDLRGGTNMVASILKTM